MEISDLPNREIKIMIIKMFTEVRRTTHELSKNVSKKIENIKKYQAEIIELKNIVTEMKNSKISFSDRLD